ncbi:MAG: RpoL/Rpb11 RNA polymerase subunit family protein [Thermoplasmata archaeon]
MEFKLLERTENSLRIKIFEADASVMYPVVENLLSDDRILEANYSVEHQELDDPILYIMCDKDSDPSEVLVENAEEIKEQFSKVYEELFEEEE